MKFTIEHIEEALDDMASEICDNYCKYFDGKQNLTDEEYEKLMKEHCEKCPLERL